MARHAFRPWDVLDSDWSPRLVRRIGAAALALVALVGGAVWALSGDPEPRGTASGLQPPAPVRPRVTFRSVDGLGSPPATASPAPTAPTRRAHPAPEPTTYHPPRRTSHPPPRPPAGPTATYLVTSSWDDGFVPNLIIRNRTGEPVRWEIRPAYPSQFQVRVVNAWNATVKSGIGTLVFTGGPLAPGADVTMGFEATKARPAKAEPTSCTINGVTC